MYKKKDKQSFSTLQKNVFFDARGLKFQHLLTPMKIIQVQ